MPLEWPVGASLPLTASAGNTNYQYGAAVTIDLDYSPRTKSTSAIINNHNTGSVTIVSDGVETNFTELVNRVNTLENKMDNIGFSLEDLTYQVLKSFEIQNKETSLLLLLIKLGALYNRQSETYSLLLHIMAGIQRYLDKDDSSTHEAMQRVTVTKEGEVNFD